MELSGVFSGVTASLADDALRHFALRHNLKKLRLGRYLDSGCAEVTRAAIDDIAAWAHEGQRDVEFVYVEGQFWLRKGVSAIRHRPFKQLMDLLISIDSEKTVVQLVPIIAGISRLFLSVGRSDEQMIDADIVL